MKAITILMTCMATWALCALPAPRVVNAAVTSVSPTPQTIQADAATHITINFDSAVNPATINAATLRVFGRWSGPASGSYSVTPDNLTARFIPDRPFFRGEWVTVSMSAGATDMLANPLPYHWNFWIRSLPGTLDLTLIGSPLSTRQGGETSVRSYGAYAGDLDGDGWSDLAIPNEDVNDVRVFLNDHSGGYGAFTVYPIPSGLVPSTNEGGDFDNDGVIDLAVGNGSPGSTLLTIFMGDGLGGFDMPPTNYPSAAAVRGVGWLDLDLDGDDDIVTANRTGSVLAIFDNNGDGTFTFDSFLDASCAGETAIAVADANEDGILDVFVGCYNGSQIVIMLGDGTGGLTYSAIKGAAGLPWMIAAGDVNGDGHVDITSANSWGDNAGVIMGNGAGGFSTNAVTYATGGFPLAIDVGDIDGDGDLDMVSSNFDGSDWTLFENNGGGVFINPRSYPTTAAGSCATLHDRDNDGDLDMTAIDEIDDVILIFDNQPGPTSVGGTAPPSRVTIRGYPNPFNPTTTVTYSVPRDGQVVVRVFDSRGAEVETLRDGVEVAGNHSVEWDASGLASGVYHVRIDAAGQRSSGKLVLLK